MPKAQPIVLQPLPDDPDEVPGRYASIDVSDQPIYGPLQLGTMKQHVETLVSSATKSDSSARIFEILQRWEARLFSRGYQFLLSGNKGWGLYGGKATATPSSIMAEGNAKKLFPVNVLGAREDKITAALSREIPGLKFAPKDPGDPADQTCADEADNYLDVWLQDSDIKGVVGKIARLFFTDDRVLLWTRSVADEQRWGTEEPDDDRTFGAGETEGVTPETENLPGDGGDTQQLDGADPDETDAADAGEGDPAQDADADAGEGDADDVTAEMAGPVEKPSICELTTAHGVLEHKCPIYADDKFAMGYVRISSEVDENILKERYPWIEDKIEAGKSVAGSSDQYDRMARINVRMAVQNASASGEGAHESEATETHHWFRPSQYRMIRDKVARATFQAHFPKGLRVTHAGAELAFVRNECLDDHIEILHSREGDGQNRRSIGANYLPLQKILNQNIALLVKYFVGCVPRRYAANGPIDVDAINSQANDPSIVTGVDLEVGQTIDQVTGIEKVPQPATGLMEFVQWLVDGAPEAMDGATPTMFGEGEVGTVGESQLNRDQSLQVFSAPWASICRGLATAATQAVKSAAANRITNIRSRTPGQAKLTVELANLQGSALCAPVSLEIPQTLAEQEAQTAALVEQAPKVKLYADIVTDPSNLPYFSEMPSLKGLNIPGLDAVEKQQGEFEILMQSGPVDNPQIPEANEKIASIQQAIAAAGAEAEAQTPNGQAVLQQLQQQLQQLQQLVPTLPPQVSTVDVAQDGSENHAVEAAIALGRLNSPEGRKLKNGNDEQKAAYLNLKLHWQEHEEMKRKLTPVPPIVPKVNVTAAIDKAPPAVQAQAWQAVGVQAGPEDFTESDELVPHEVTVEKEGVDSNGVPVKQKISTVNPGGRLN